KNGEIYGIEQKYTFKNQNGKRIFKAPLEGIRKQSKKQLDTILVSHKTKNKVTTRNSNQINIRGKNKFKYQDIETPRGQLHKEMVYLKSHVYKTKIERVSSKVTTDFIKKVANQSYKNALLKRLEEIDNNPKWAFTGKNSLKKNPIYIN